MCGPLLIPAGTRHACSTHMSKTLICIFKKSFKKWVYRETNSFSESLRNQHTAACKSKSPDVQSWFTCKGGTVSLSEDHTITITEQEIAASIYLPLLGDFF